MADESDISTKDLVERHERLITAQQKKLKWWQALAIAAITASGAGAVAVAKGLYAQGEKSGALEIRLQHLEKELNDIKNSVDRVRELLFRIRREPQPRNDP